MKKGKIINIVLVLAVVVLLSIFALAVRISPTADNVAVLRTAGMTCGSCANDIEKALQAEGGVASVEVDVDGGWVVVGYDSKKTGPDAIVSTVAGLGYRSKVAEQLSVEQFRKITGRNPGQGVTRKTGCGGGCGANKNGN
ncbi:MAG: heavy-metal-associated domain-containing protein [Geobacteraceae bacterium]|nr:heavy-metal-associated domain-containing protein [Geobacteraceae bacterium]